jgi:hypothetical protein
MIGVICRVFKGETLAGCLQMTPSQLRGWYLESIRQEAREQLTMINTMAVFHQDQEGRKKSLGLLERRAKPFDPEQDGEFGEAQMNALVKAFGGTTLKSTE